MDIRRVSPASLLSHVCTSESLLGTTFYWEIFFGKTVDKIRVDLSKNGLLGDN